MTSLRDLQSSFLDGLLYEYTAPACALIDGNGITPERRLAIYRNNVVEGFLKTLEAAFPVLVQLAGSDWFRQTGRQYLRHSPSRSGNIHYIGERFASFLDEALARTEHDYFADVARLEWAYQDVLVAADHAGLDPGALSAVAPDDYGDLTFQLHPALRLVTSRFPILAIWKAHQPDANTLDPIRLDAGGSHVLVIRRDDHVELRELPAGEYALLDAFACGERFESAADAALNTDPTLDLGAALAHIAQLGTLVNFATGARL